MKQGRMARKTPNTVVELPYFEGFWEKGVKVETADRYSVCLKNEPMDFLIMRLCEQDETVNCTFLNWKKTSGAMKQE